MSVLLSGSEPRVSPAAKCHPGQSSSYPCRYRWCASRGPSRRWSLMIDEERHQAGNAIPHGIGHEREPADHVAVHHIVDFAARGVRPLSGEDLIVIALIGSPPLAFDGISLLRSRGGEFTERTGVLTRRCRPVKAVFFSWSA